MVELKFDTEGITYCPMNETATREECEGCKYRKLELPWDTKAVCIFEDKFPEPKE